MTRIAGIFAAALLLPACAFAPAAMSLEESHLYFPLREGCEWTYQVAREGVTPRTLTLRAERPVARDGIEYFHMGGGTFHFADSAGAGVHRNPTDLPRDQAYLFVRFPIRIGDRWESQSPDEDVDPDGRLIVRALDSNAWEVLGTETVTTPAGAFVCLKVRTESTEERYGKLESRHIVTRWFAAGVGLVKWEHEGKYNLRYTPITLKPEIGILVSRRSP